MFACKDVLALEPFFNPIATNPCKVELQSNKERIGRNFFCLSKLIPFVNCLAQPDCCSEAFPTCELEFLTQQSQSHGIPVKPGDGWHGGAEGQQG